jgi:hypothetical protein
MSLKDTTPDPLQHDCRKTLEKVRLALDNGLTEEEEKQLLIEINMCSYCLEKFEIEQSFKKYLCDKVKRHPCNPKLAEQIRISIHNITDRWERS